MTESDIRTRILCLLQQEEGHEFKTQPTNYRSSLEGRESIGYVYSDRLANVLRSEAPKESVVEWYNKLLSGIDRLSDTEIRITLFDANDLSFGVFTDRDATRLLAVMAYSGTSNHMGFAG